MRSEEGGGAIVKYLLQWCLVLGPLLAASWPARSQDLGEVVSLNPVVVSGVAGTFQAKLSDLLKGQQTFSDKRHYAPQAMLRFFVEDVSKTPSSTPLQITVQMSESDVDLNLDEHGYFVLPDFGMKSRKQATLVANRAEGAIVIHPVVRTPADGEGITHLGDLRLECEVSWAIQKGSASLAIRSMFAIGGRVCHSHNIAVDFYAPKKLLSVTMVDGQKTQQLRIGRSGHVYMPPVSDESWPDNTLVQFVYLAKP